ncbi:MAG TPA: hypothetical protein VGY51_10035 [Acidimicrobiales bacterium]|nr:hypothetical protein [Acidimicrobiales bacterium]
MTVREQLQAVAPRLGRPARTDPTEQLSGVQPPAGPSMLFERCAWTLVWLGVLTSGLGFWGAWSSWTGAAVVAPLLVVVGAIGMAVVWMVGNPNAPVMQVVAFGSALTAVGVPQAVATHTRQYFTTDSAAFNQVAAQVLLRGMNPYSASMAPAAKLLNFPSHFWTYTVDGGHVTTVSYPAGSFLLQAPIMALGFHHEVTDWMDLAAWLVTGVLLFVMVPASLRWLPALIVLTPLFVGMFANGGTDALFFPFLVVAVWRWDRFGTGNGAGMAGWIGPLCLGLACCIKQTPWFCVPFLVIGVALEAHRGGRNPWPVASRYLGSVVAVFTVINLPFIIWQPAAWWRGAFLPFAQPLVADGQGAVTLALHGFTGGASLVLLSVAGGLAYVALVAAFILWYPRMKRVWLFLLPGVLFLPGRSLSSYLIDFFPAAVIAALTVATPAPASRTRATAARRWAALAVAGPMVAAAAVSWVAFTSAPLRLSVDGFRTSNATQRLDAVTVRVHNVSGRSVTPHFMVTIGGSHPTGFWSPATRGPVVIGPGASATVTIRPNDYTWSPNRGTYWLVEAYTSSPNALSTSPPQFWRLGRAQ